MNILTFEKRHIKEAAALALANYRDERQVVKELPQLCEVPDLNGFAENGLGVAAFENGKMIGFLCCNEPFDNAFRATDVRGIFSPMGANAAISKNRSKIYAAMYQAAAAKWIKTGAVSHAVCLYAHDEELQRQFFYYGFGLRCIDAIRPMELIDCELCADYDFVELPKAECHLVYPLHLALYSHYRESPFFMNRTPETQEELMVSSVQEDGRYFVAKQNGELCAFLKISASGETFAATGNSYLHIRGAYCLPEHRGKGVYQNLLNFAISALKREGYTRLGVNFESFNPTGRGFWLKYFAPYTHSVVRRIDERIVQRGFTNG
ncbi:MAG: GNAT family N-acetyltransferase [Lachnospiraceae bacterium]|nr:GNAT family N-acetyltransferase [Lachnospiraceae bacterium]